MAVSGRVCFVILFSVALAPGRVAAVQEATAIAPPAEQGPLLAPLLTEDARLAWDALRDDAARADFVRAFWTERDPTPGTTSNERREIFEARARRAIEQFAEGATPGYATDRGRVMLVYGLPDELELRAVPADAAPTLTWIYTRLRQPVTVLFAEEGDAFRFKGEEPELSEAEFMRSLRDDLRLRLATAVGGQQGALEWPEEPVAESGVTESDPESADEPGDASSAGADDESGNPSGAGTDGESPLSESGDSEEDSEATVPAVAEGPVLPPAPELAPEVKIWMEMVFSGVQRQEIELRRRLHFFPAPEGTYTALSFEVGKASLEFAVPENLEMTESGTVVPPVVDETLSEMPVSASEMAAAHLEDLAGQEPEEGRADLRIFGAFLQGEPGEENTLHSFIIPYELMESAGDDESSPALSLGVTLFPGTYRLAWGVLDATTGLAVTRDETVEIPSFGQGALRLTQPLLAAQELRDDSRPMNTTTIYQGVRLGNVLIANNVDDVFDRNATVEIIAVVTGWASDPAAPGKPRLEVAYRILEGLDGERSLARLPEQLLDFHVLGQQIPLGQVKRLQPGQSYRIEVRVKDLVSGIETVQRAALHLRDVPAPETEDGVQ